MPDTSWPRPWPICGGLNRCDTPGLRTHRNRTGVQYRGGVPDRLTDQQQTLLGILREHIKRTGYPPTVREIIDVGPWTSTSSVAAQLRALETKGWITRVANRPRALQIVGDDDSGDQPRPMGSDPVVLRRWIVGAVAAYLRQIGWTPEPGRLATEDETWDRAARFIDACTDPRGEAMVVASVADLLGTTT